MISADDIEAFQMPDWASGHAGGMYTALHAALPTKDGRRCGNAVMVGLSDRQWEQAPITYKVVTDAGNIMRLNENELKELFHPPEYLMRTLLPAHIMALEMELYS